MKKVIFILLLIIPTVIAITPDLFQEYTHLNDAIKDNYNSKILRENLNNFTILNLTGERSFTNDNNSLIATYTFNSDVNLTNILVYDEIPINFSQSTQGLRLKSATDTTIKIIQESPVVITIYYPTITEYESRSFSYSLNTTTKEANFTEPLILQGPEKPEDFNPYSLIKYWWILFIIFLGIIIWAFHSYFPKNILRRDWEGKIKPS